MGASQRARVRLPPLKAAYTFLLFIGGDRGVELFSLASQLLYALPRTNAAHGWVRCSARAAIQPEQRTATRSEL